eukprot:3150888-Ditylum_brightwellii.AAC.1
MMIKNMSSIDGVDPLDNLTETMMDFLEQRMSAYAYKHLQDRLRDRKAANRNLFFVMYNLYTKVI